MNEVLRPRGERGSPPGTAAFGMAVFLASLTVLFGAGVVAYWVVRHRAPVWPPPEAPTLPLGLWISTVLLAIAGVTIQLALVAIRRGNQARLIRMLVATLGVALLFVASQAWNWWQFYRLDSTFQWHLYGFTYYMLTGLHAAHVLGGVAALGVVLVRAWLGHYTWGRYLGVRLTAIYWHFLGVMWLLLFALLLLDS